MVSGRNFGVTLGKFKRVHIYNSVHRVRNAELNCVFTNLWFLLVSARKLRYFEARCYVPSSSQHFTIRGFVLCEVKSVSDNPKF
jgi:hypothetical protein